MHLPSITHKGNFGINALNCNLNTFSLSGRHFIYVMGDFNADERTIQNYCPKLTQSAKISIRQIFSHFYKNPLNYDHIYEVN